MVSYMNAKMTNRDLVKIQHIALIPDGNRRWAKKKAYPKLKGHHVAIEVTLPKLMSAIQKSGIPYFTFWALSPENITERSKEEVKNLFYLLRMFLKKKRKELQEKEIRIKVIGDINGLPKNLQNDIQKTIEDTKEYKKLTLIFGLNYGGRDEIVRAVKRMLMREFRIQDLSKEHLSQYLDTAGIPDPDIIIRTGAEQRLSGFMLWQSEYSELFFSPTFFPDFTEEELQSIIYNFHKRKRRFGK